MIWVETPTNPLLRLADLEWIAQLARRNGCLAVADNTFASPYVQRPLELGFDIVVHSTTKYLNGHSDMVGGVAAVGENRELAEKMKFLQNSVGAIQGPLAGLVYTLQGTLGNLVRTLQAIHDQKSGAEA